MPFAAYVVLFLAGVTWGLWNAFGDALFAPPEGDSAPGARPAGGLQRTFFAALATGFGGSGALLTRAARWSSAGNFGGALLTGLLFAALVAVVTRIVLDEDRRLSAP